MNIEYVYCIFLFFILTPGILFQVSKNKLISAFIHGIIFSFFVYFILYNLESFDDNGNDNINESDNNNEKIDIFLDSSCNSLLDDSEPPEDMPLYLIQDFKCINMEDWKD